MEIFMLIIFCGCYLLIGRIVMFISCKIERKLNPNVLFLGTELIDLFFWPLTLIIYFSIGAGFILGKILFLDEPT